MAIFANLKLYIIIILLLAIIGIGAWAGILYSKNNSKKLEIEKLNLKLQTLEESLQSTENKLEDLKKIHEMQQRAYNKFIMDSNKIDKYSKDQLLKALNNEKIN